MRAFSFMIWKKRARRLRLHRLLQSLNLIKIAAHRQARIVTHHQSVKQMKEIQKFRSAGGKILYVSSKREKP